MIAYINGTVEQLTDQYAVLENQGIGYIINASSATLSRLPRRGEEARLYTYLQVKEDDLSLYGFLAQEEIRLFRLLISISGIGPKVAMAVLAVMPPEHIMTAIISQDAVAFSKVPGVGKKTAQRITLELQDKIKSQDWASHDDSAIAVMAGGGALDEKSTEKQDAIEALLSLGYSRSESVRAVLSTATEDMPVEQIIRLALKKLI